MRVVLVVVTTNRGKKGVVYSVQFMISMIFPNVNDNVGRTLENDRDIIDFRFTYIHFIISFYIFQSVKNQQKTLFRII